jgi:ATP synthase protein I
MSQSPHSSEPPGRSGDPWHAVSYLITGVGLYGLAGWLLDAWLDTSFLLPVGIVLGAVLGVYLTYVRFRSSNHD